MISFLFVIHFIVAAALILIVLLQPGKGSTALGGGMQNVLDSASISTFFTKATIFLGITLFITSLFIAVLAKKNLTSDDDELLKLQPSTMDNANDITNDFPKLDDIPQTMPQ